MNREHDQETETETNVTIQQVKADDWFIQLVSHLLAETATVGADGASQEAKVRAAAFRTMLGLLVGGVGIAPPPGEMGGVFESVDDARWTIGSVVRVVRDKRVASWTTDTRASFSLSDEASSRVTSWRATAVRSEQALDRSSGGKLRPLGEIIWLIISSAVETPELSFAIVLVLASEIGGERGVLGTSGPRDSVRAVKT